MKTVVTSEYEMQFAMKDGKKLHKFSMKGATSEKAARSQLRDELGQVLDQIEEADKVDEKSKGGKPE
jgi:hypothetical protein